MNINTVTLAARDFLARRGASDEHIPQWICKERATKSGRKRTAARRVAPNLACGCVARRLQTHCGYAPSSRLATGQIGRNERGRIYEMDHLGSTGFLRSLLLRNPDSSSQQATTTNVRKSSDPFWVRSIKRYE